MEIIELENLLGKPTRKNKTFQVRKNSLANFFLKAGVVTFLKRPFFLVNGTTKFCDSTIFKFYLFI